MKYVTTPAFDRDIKRLTKTERKLFLESVFDKFIPTADLHAKDPSSTWPKGLRVKGVQAAPGIWEMTWNMRQPDGRATWEWTEIDNEPAIRWRRVGNHSIFKLP